MDTDYLVLKRASASRLSGEWSEDDYDVLADGLVVGRILRAAAAPVGTPWLWTLAFDYHEDRTPIYGYEPTREEAMTASAKSWRRRSGHDENTRVKSGHLARLPFRDGELEWRKSDPTKNRPRPLAGHQRRRHPEKSHLP